MFKPVHFYPTNSADFTCLTLRKKKKNKDFTCMFLEHSVLLLVGNHLLLSCPSFLTACSEFLKSDTGNPV